MCFTEASSWMALAVGLAGFGIAVKRGGPTRTLAFGVLPVIVIQLWEALMHRWAATQRTVPSLERLAMLSTYAQPLAFIAAATLAAKRRQVPRWPLLIAMAVYTALSIGRAIRLWHRLRPNVARTDCTDRGDRCRLEWGWWDTSGERGEEPPLVPRLHVLLYFVLLTAAISRFAPDRLRNYYLALMIGTFTLAYVAFDEPVGSKWCFLGVALPVSLALFPVERVKAW